MPLRDVCGGLYPPVCAREAACGDRIRPWGAVVCTLVCPSDAVPVAVPSDIVDRICGNRKEPRVRVGTYTQNL